MLSHYVNGADRYRPTTKIVAKSAEIKAGQIQSNLNEGSFGNSYGTKLNLPDTEL